MTREDARESDDPPPPLDNSGDRASDPYAHAVGKARAAMASASEALTTGREALRVSQAIEAKLGNSPDPLIGVEGRGLFGRLATMSVDQQLALSKIDGLAAMAAADRAAAAADRAAAALAAESRKTSVAKVVGWIAAPALSIAVASFLAYIAGFHR